MDDDSLAKQLGRLRVRAGNPSLRDLERLTDRQGRRMSRASIQDKFSGSSALKMVQVLALVQACTDYARSIGAPLPPADVDEQAWREKAAHPPKPRIQPTSKAEHGSAENQKKTTLPELESLISPLINAGMEDIAHIATEGINRPLETWLPTVLVALGNAQMDFQGFLNLAVHEPVQQTVRILTSITEEEAENVANRYFAMCLLAKPAVEIPKFLVALRRHDGESSYWYADNFIDALAGKGEWPGSTRSDLADTLRALRAATLKDDANKLAEAIGMHSWPRVALATAGAFPDNFLSDRELILHSAQKGGPKRLLRLISCLREEEIPGIDPRKELESLLISVPQGKRADFSHVLSDAGMHPEAQRLLELANEVPF
ncbi:MULTISPECIES: hypothetical protein [unclassified Streptomyces]|uniref:hypothetical protein n=1 Tax=unclassified Streptomyces TaxID=2593676 RepID=UPI0036E5185C